MCLTEYDSRVRLGAFGLAMEWKHTLWRRLRMKKKIQIFLFFLYDNCVLHFLFQCFAEQGEMVGRRCYQRSLTYRYTVQGMDQKH